MAISLSSTTTGTAIGRIMSKMGITSPVDRVRTKILNQLNLCQKELWDEIIKDPKIKTLYVVETPTPLTIINRLFTLTDISDYQEVSAVRVNGWGKVNPTDWDTIEELERDKFAEKEIYYAVYGDTLKIFIGRRLSQVDNDFYLKYVRLCKTLVANSDLLDVPDGYEDKLINKVVLSIGSVPPSPEPKDKK